MRDDDDPDFLFAGVGIAGVFLALFLTLGFALMRGVFEALNWLLTAGVPAAYRGARWSGRGLRQVWRRRFTFVTFEARGRLYVPYTPATEERLDELVAHTTGRMTRTPGASGGKYVDLRLLGTPFTLRRRQADATIRTLMQLYESSNQARSAMTITMNGKVIRERKPAPNVPAPAVV